MPDDDGYFDERVAARYDESVRGDVRPGGRRPAVDLLVELAGSGRALELGIGTGRIALPLARRGVPVHGIELSNAMAARLRAKPGGERHRRRRSATSRPPRSTGRSRVAYLVFNTIMNLTTQAAQVACFRNVAAHLAPGGCFVIEVGGPGAPAAPARRDVPCVPRERDEVGLRRVRRRETGADVAPLRARRRASRTPVDPVPLRVARGARPDGGARRHDAARALGRMEARAVHERERPSTSRSGRNWTREPHAVLHGNDARRLHRRPERLAGLAVHPRPRGRRSR